MQHSLTNHQKWLNKNQSNWQIHGDDSCDDLWYIGVVFLSTSKISIPLDTAGESVRFLFLNPLPLLLGIQEIIQQSIPKKCSDSFPRSVSVYKSGIARKIPLPSPPSVSSVKNSASQRWESNFCRNSSKTLKDWNSVELMRPVERQNLQLQMGLKPYL